jgi:hypothetical protein
VRAGVQHAPAATLGRLYEVNDLALIRTQAVSEETLVPLKSVSKALVTGAMVVGVAILAAMA